VDHTGVHGEATAWWRHEDAGNRWAGVGVTIRYTYADRGGHFFYHKPKTEPKRTEPNSKVYYTTVKSKSAAKCPTYYFCR
jgi:hypothetical protein